LIRLEGNRANVGKDESWATESGDKTDNSIDSRYDEKGKESIFDLCELYMLMARCDLPDIL